MSHFHIVAGAWLGEVPPTQARASASHGEEGSLVAYAAESPQSRGCQPGAAVQPPTGAWPTGAGGLAPVLALVSAAWFGNAGLVMEHLET